jgi:hypothetical protein
MINHHDSNKLLLVKLARTAGKDSSWVFQACPNFRVVHCWPVIVQADTTPSQKQYCFY